MAKNGPIGNGRIGEIKDGTQFYNSVTNLWQKRNPDNGRIMDVKTSGGRFKDIRREK